MSDVIVAEIKNFGNWADLEKKQQKLSHEICDNNGDTGHANVSAGTHLQLSQQTTRLNSVRYFARFFLRRSAIR